MSLSPLILSDSRLDAQARDRSASRRPSRPQSTADGTDLLVPTPHRTKGMSRRGGARHLIVTADDYGRSAWINEAIERSITSGIVTSTSVMANFPDASRVAYLASTLPDVSIGLHLNLTVGRPISPWRDVPSLVGVDGKFWPLPTFVKRLLTGRLRRTEISREVEAQVNALASTGVVVNHLDSHQHIHVFPAVTRALLEIGSRFGITTIRSNRRFFLATVAAQPRQRTMQWRHFLRWPGSLPSQWWKYRQRVAIRRANFNSPDFLLSPLPTISTTSVETAVQQLSEAFLHIPPGVSELNVHPGAHEVELGVVTAPVLRDSLNRLEVTLCRHGDV